jgi:hypothetical protein
MRKTEDLTGRVFGYLTVLEFGGRGKRGQARWLCKCVCGKIKIIDAADLKKGTTLSCGCKKGELISKRNIRELAGQKFNRWTVISFFGIKNGKAWWNCKCDCGVEKAVDGTRLTGGGSQSCGCARVDFTSNMSRTHGLSKTHPLYSVWKSTHGRCRGYNPDDIPCYVDKGITVCDRWSGPVDSLIL